MIFYVGARETEQGNEIWWCRKQKRKEIQQNYESFSKKEFV